MNSILLKAFTEYCAFEICNFLKNVRNYEHSMYTNFQ